MASTQLLNDYVSVLQPLTSSLTSSCQTLSSYLTVIEETQGAATSLNGREVRKDFCDLLLLLQQSEEKMLVIQNHFAECLQPANPAPKI